MSSTLISQKRVFFPHLDALRFFAFMSVFLSHCFTSKNPDTLTSPVYQLISLLRNSGHLGVNFFFVLSGFLITYLLLEERDHFQKIHLREFYIRRILRIWPLYYAIVAVGFLLFPLLNSSADFIPNADIRYYLVFAGNFDTIIKGLPSRVLGVLWSIAVEEQFYLVWPILLAVLPPRYYARMFGCIVSISLVYRAAHQHEGLVLAFGTLSVISDMAVGALLAYKSRSDLRFRTMLSNLSKVRISILYLAGIGLILVRHDLIGHLPALAIIERVVLSIFFAFIIAEQNWAQNSPLKFSKIKGLSGLGKITYGLYCLHFLGILCATQVANRLHLENTWWRLIFFDTTLGLGVSLLIAALSYRFYEKPFLKMKEQFGFLTKKCNGTNAENRTPGRVQRGRPC